jgi:2-polyprenyl-3-methyl-5-hydroxy-6-metoxy-1,4-benzoquinol methylase
MKIESTPKSATLQLNDIRPSVIDDQVAEACAKDVAYLQKFTNLFEARSCPLCQSKEFSTFCEKNGFSHLSCNGCLSVLMNPAPSSALLNDFYGQSENYKIWGSYVYPLTQKSRWETLHKSRSEKILKAVQDFLPLRGDPSVIPLKYLEIGAGTGDTAARFRADSIKRPVEISVVEINPTMLEILEERSIAAYRLEKVKDGSQDVVAAFEVLEHVLDPSEVLKTAFKKLAPGGLFIFSTPNALSLEVQSLKENSTTVDHEHITVMSLVGLAIGASNAGFTIRKLEAAGSLDVELIQRARGMATEHPIFNHQIGWGSQEDISQANLSSSSFGIFQKPSGIFK